MRTGLGLGADNGAGCGHPCLRIETWGTQSGGDPSGRSWLKVVESLGCAGLVAGPSASLRMTEVLVG
jgi:hypothetical protein